METSKKPKWTPDPSKLPPLKAGEVRLLSGGNPQIAKGDGDGPVQAYIAAMPGWKRAVGARIDALVMATVPDARKAVRWNSPFWGRPGQGWMLNLGCLNRYIKIGFFRGASLVPMPPEPSKHAEMRYLHVFEDRPLGEAQFVDWLKQAAAIPGPELF